LGVAHHQLCAISFCAGIDRTAASAVLRDGFFQEHGDPSLGACLEYFLMEMISHADDDRIESLLHEHRAIIGIDRLRWNTIDLGKIQSFGHRTVGYRYHFDLR
jgi:hypothetical protein